ncbi:MAG: DegV family protein [Coriobacteriia bacterium]|nr:DegV family protein [Coriobacteriia bacterium]
MCVNVVTDSVASIPAELNTQYGIDVVSLYVNEGERTTRELDMDVDDFYTRLPAMRVLPTSSQPSVDSLMCAFQHAVERGCDVVGVFISEKMSGTMATARMAAEMVLKDHPGVRIELVDSGSNSMEEGFGALAAAKAAQMGQSLEQCVQAATATLKRTRYLFTPETLEPLRRGGRIGGATALLGGLLQIKPILTVEDGETQTFAKVRTRARAMAEIARKLADDMCAYGLSQIVVHYIGSREVARKFAEEHIEPIVGYSVRLVPVSPVVGVHVGPAVGIVYETERDWA